MPVVVVAYAAYATYAAYTAYTVFTVIAAIGAVAAAAGVVTGNKDLVKVGSVLGIVGGVGSVATSAGAMGTEATTTAGTETAAAESTTVAAETAPASGEVATQTMKDVVPTAAPTAAPAAEAGATAAAAPTTQVGATVQASSAATVDPSKLPVDGVAQAPSAAEPSIFGAVQDFAKPMIDFAQKNQMLTYGMMQVGGEALKGLFDTTKESQKAALDARAESDRAQAALAQQRAANMTAPVPTARVIGPRRDVFGNATQPVYAAPTVGLLNTQVTGAPK